MKKSIPFTREYYLFVFLLVHPKKGHAKLITDSAQGRDSTVVFDGF